MANPQTVCSGCGIEFTAENPRYCQTKAMHRDCYLDKYFPLKDGSLRFNPLPRTPDQIAEIDPGYKHWLTQRRNRKARLSV